MRSCGNCQLPNNYSWCWFFFFCIANWWYIDVSMANTNNKPAWAIQVLLNGDNRRLSQTVKISWNAFALVSTIFFMAITVYIFSHNILQQITIALWVLWFIFFSRVFVYVCSLSRALVLSSHDVITNHAHTTRKKTKPTKLSHCRWIMEHNIRNGRYQWMPCIALHRLSFWARCDVQLLNVSLSAPISSGNLLFFLIFVFSRLFWLNAFFTRFSCCCHCCFLLVCLCQSFTDLRARSPRFPHSSFIHGLVYRDFGEWTSTKGLCCRSRFGDSKCPTNVLLCVLLVFRYLMAYTQNSISQSVSAVNTLSLSFYCLCLFVFFLPAI